MAKSRIGRGGQGPTPPRFRGAGDGPKLADLLQRAKSAVNLESLVAKKPVAILNLQASGVPELSVAAPIPPSQALKANRCACEGASLIHSGRPAQAIAPLKRSVQLDPRVAAYHHDLGVALVAAGRLEEAAEPFTAAIRLNPGFASAHYYLAFVFDSLGQEEKALASYQAAVALQPDHVAAQLRLGGLYLARRLHAESVAAFRAAAAAGPGTMTARIAKVRALEASGAFDEALAEMRAIVATHPESAEAHATLGMLLSQVGHSAEAAAHYERSAVLSPATSAAWFGVATNRKFTTADRPLIERVKAALARSELTPRYRQSLHFALGKAYDDLGDYESAMRNFEAANRLRALGGRVNRAAHAWNVNRVIEATPPGYRDRQPDPGIEDATPILIVGMPRSGTTLTERILSSHPTVAAGGELTFWGMRDAPREAFWSRTSTPGATRRLADDYLATLRAFGPDAKRVTDKMPSNFMWLGLIHRVFPNATLIHCRRHPIDTALSIFTTNFERHLDFAAERGDLVFYIRQYQRLMAHWREVLPPDRFVEIDYEALVSDPEPHTRHLIDACGLEWSEACLTPHRNTRMIMTASVWQARQPIYRSSVERWRRYEPWLGELLELTPKP
jgi:tetratricopeptide (TPR) repeat protein